MKSKNPSPALYRDREISARTIAPVRGVSWQRLGLEDDHAERFEVVLRLMLVVCVGVAVFTCGVGTGGSADGMNSAARDTSANSPACVAAAGTFLPPAGVPAAQKL